MTLNEWLSQQKITDAQMAKKLSVTTQAINNYRNKRRVPRAEIMARITQATNGAVTPNDFFMHGGDCRA